MGETNRLESFTFYSNGKGMLLNVENLVKILNLFK